MKFRDEPYKMGSIILFTLFIMMGWKYVGLRNAYTEAETTKVKFCKENVQLRKTIDTLKKETYLLNMDNSRYLDVIQKMEEENEL